MTNTDHFLYLVKALFHFSGGLSLIFSSHVIFYYIIGGGVQQYIYKQEPIRKCPGRRPAINYPVYGETTQVRRRRFERAIGPSQTHTIRIHYSPIRVSYQEKGNVSSCVKNYYT